MKKGFTLMEMLVVIAIMSMLAAAVVRGIKSVQRQANAVLCQSHMRNLHEATMNYCSETGRFPLAGSAEFHQKRKVDTFVNRDGWVGWVHASKEKKSYSDKVTHAPEYVHASWDGELARLAVEQGAIFTHAGRDRSVYFCKQFNNGKGNPVRTYAMNKFFGSRRSGQPVNSRSLSSVGEGSRRAMFCELPEAAVTKRQCGELGFKAEPGNGDISKRQALADDSVWETDEPYGCWHRKSGKLYGHVIFCDGHIESLTPEGTPDDQKDGLTTEDIANEMLNGER